MYPVIGHAHPSIKYTILFQAVRYGLECVYIFPLMSLRQFLSCLPLGSSSLCFYYERNPIFHYIS